MKYYIKLKFIGKKSINWEFMIDRTKHPQEFNSEKEANDFMNWNTYGKAKRNEYKVVRS